MGIDPPKTQLELISRHLERGEFQLGLQKTKQLQLKFPKSSILCNLQGVFYFKMLLFEEAIQSFTRSLEICLDYEEPRNNLAAVHNTIGLSLRDKGNFEDSIEHFKKAISIQPNLHQLYNNMGTVYQDMGDQELAMKSYATMQTEFNLSTPILHQGLTLKVKQGLGLLRVPNRCPHCGHSGS